MDEMQRCPRIGAQAYDIARIRRDLRLEQDHIEHRDTALIKR